MSNVSEPSPSNGGGDQANQGIPRSEHARLRSGQGRPIGQVVNDVQRASPQDVFIQPDDGRYVVRGPKGREHVIEATGEHVTSLRRPDVAHQARIRSGIIKPATEKEFQRLKGFLA